MRITASVTTVPDPFADMAGIIPDSVVIIIVITGISVMVTHLKMGIILWIPVIMVPVIIVP